MPRASSALPAERVDVDVPEDLPLVVADAGLIERVIANVVENALRYYPPDETRAHHRRHSYGASVVLRVVDRGPGVPDDSKRGHLQRLPAPR